MGDVPGSASAHRQHVRSQVVFYLGWIAMVLIETTLRSLTGLVIGLFTFILGGYLWALWHIRRTEAGAKIHGPVLVLIDSLLRRWPGAGLPLAALLGGAPGVGLVFKKQDHAGAANYALTASVMYAGFWFAIHGLRPSLGVPVRTWPSLEVLSHVEHDLRGWFA